MSTQTQMLFKIERLAEDIRKGLYARSRLDERKHTIVDQATLDDIAEALVEILDDINQKDHQHRFDALDRCILCSTHWDDLQRSGHLGFTFGRDES